MSTKRKKTAPQSRKTSSGFMRTLQRSTRNTAFRRSYVIVSLAILFGTTLLWTILGARLQLHNADQLSDPYLFSSWATFHGTTFPGQHTFLLKWPIFWLLNVVGISSASLLAATVGVVMVTVATLVFVLSKIERRPLVFGTICMGLSLALLLVPAQPYAGGLLPVNMAMLTTRNLEYAVYLAALAFYSRARWVRSRDFALATALLTVLIASDKLFMSLSIGGALLALIVYAAMRAWKLVSFAVRWLAGSAVAAVGATALLFALSGAQVTHLTSGSTASPYSVISSAQNAVLAIAYSILGLLTNAGANPVYDNVILKRLPAQLAHSLTSLSILAYFAAFLVLIYALVLVWRIVRRVPKAKAKETSVATLLALSLIWSTVAAFGVFMVSNHYYAVDSRYLTIGLFALVITVSVELRQVRWQRPERLLLVAGGLLAALCIAVPTSVHVSRTQSTALNNLNERNATIAVALRRHKVDVLVGSYWRVLPVKLAMHGNINAMPLATCTQPQTGLDSTAWQPNLRHHGFAYLLTVNGSVAGFPDCTLHTIVSAYGRPNAMQVVAGTIAHPTEALLFYDQGSHPAVPGEEKAIPASILPVTLSSLPDTGCAGPTVMQVVAHEDDDLLFMNPDLLHEIHAGNCIRTVYLTAGNDGQGRLYWLARQLGAEAAYNSMLGKKYVWVQQTVQLADNEYVTFASPRGVDGISLIFFNLPDGGLHGNGFPMSNFQSLAKLYSGVITSIQTVDGSSSYTSSQLVAALAQLMQTYRPSDIHTQADVPSSLYPDHNDHIATGQFTEAAAATYDQAEYGGRVTTPLTRYIGYPIHGYAQNLSGADLEQKEAAFIAYAQFDGSVCHSIAVCDEVPTYGSYLTREYTEDPAMP